MPRCERSWRFSFAAHRVSPRRRKSCAAWSTWSRCGWGFGRASLRPSMPSAVPTSAASRTIFSSLWAAEPTWSASLRNRASFVRWRSSPGHSTPNRSECSTPAFPKTPPPQAFLLSRALVDVARGVYAVDKLAPSAIAEVIVGAMRTVDPTFGAGQVRPEYLETLTKNLYRGLPRRARRPLEEAAAAYGPSPKPRLEDWALRVRKTAARVALLISDDPAGAVGILRRTEGDLARLEGVTLERGMAVIADTLR